MSEPIRVAIALRPASGGMRRHVESLAAHLPRSRFALTVFAPPDTVLDLPPHIPRVPLAIRAQTSLMTDLRTTRHFAQLLRGNFDLVHAHGARGGFISVLAARRVGLPALLTAHNLLPPLGLVAHVALRLTCRGARRVI